MPLHQLKRGLQGLVGRFGYRLVPQERDPMSLQRILQSLPIQTVIDVGANNGRTCEGWMRTYPKAHVHAIEALGDYYRRLEEMAASSQGRMTAWNYAASDEGGELTFIEHQDHPSSSSMLHSTKLSHELLPFTKKTREHTVKAVRLADLFKENGVVLDHPIFIKLDVQGAEAKVLRGCDEFLSATMAALVEVNLESLYEGQASFQEILAFLQSHGLRFSGILEQVHEPSGSPIYLDAVFINRSPR